MNETTTAIVDALYEHTMFGLNLLPIDKIGFFNYGYWKGGVSSIEIAQINLIETLVDFFQAKDGNILDVACGKGASSKFLTKYFDPGHITGINISEHQLEVCKVVAPECTFKLMDATRLQFENLSYDNILCIESALHFKTRDKFFNEAYRILRPGGRLAMSDLLMDYEVLERMVRTNLRGELTKNQMMILEAHPKENYVPNLSVYRDNILKAGFRHVRVEDVTEHYPKAIGEYEFKRREAEFDKRRDYNVFEGIMRGWNEPRLLFAGCLVYAIK